MDAKKYIKEINLFLFDMDGTLYLGDRLYDFTKELLEFEKKYSKSLNEYIDEPITEICGVKMRIILSKNIWSLWSALLLKKYRSR